LSVAVFPTVLHICIRKPTGQSQGMFKQCNGLWLLDKKILYAVFRQKSMWNHNKCTVLQYACSLVFPFKFCSFYHIFNTQ